jgi:hypothetical protein
MIDLVMRVHYSLSSIGRIICVAGKKTFMNLVVGDHDASEQLTCRARVDSS